MEPHFAHYPWYGITSGPDIQQGDIFDACRVWDPESTTFFEEEKPVFTYAKQDVIVLTQSCDLVPGQRKTCRKGLPVISCVSGSHQIFHRFGEIGSFHPSRD